MGGVVVKKSLVGECLAEFVGAWILIFIGCGAVASMVLNNASVSQWEIGILWGMAVTIAIYVTGAVSGTHINPAVTIALATFKGFDKKKVVPYILAQIAGCFTGAATVYLLFKDLFIAFESQNGIVRNSLDGLATAGIFSTYPHVNISYSTAFIVEVFITMILMMVILAVGEGKNTVAPKMNLGPLFIGVVIAILGTSFGVLTGFAMNPARDFGPKIFAMLAGWGSSALGENMYFWIPIAGPIVGALVGTFIFEKVIVSHMQGEKHTSEREAIEKEVSHPINI